MVKVDRSFPAPPSLLIEAQKVNGSYSMKDVVERLKEDFHDKCYICELKNLPDPQIEHLLPHKNRKYKERVFDWNNLFWCCVHCNQVKNRSIYDDGIIDCCKEDPEELLRFSFENNEVKVEPFDLEDEKSKLTAKLICDTFYLNNTAMQKVACDNRLKELSKNMSILYRELRRYKNNPKSRDNFLRVKGLLKRETAFAGFKRCYVRERLNDYPELTDCV